MVLEKTAVPCWFFYTDTGVFDGSLKAASVSQLIASISGNVVLETNSVASNSVVRDGDNLELEKTVSCPRCRQILKVPFGKRGIAKCGKCNERIPVSEPILETNVSSNAAG